MSEYNFIVIRGSIVKVKDAQERANAIRTMAEEGKRKFSKNFARANTREDIKDSSQAQNRKKIAFAHATKERLGERFPAGHFHSDKVISCPQQTRVPAPASSTCTLFPQISQT